MKRSVAAVLFCLAGMPASAQTSKIPVVVEASVNDKDQVGRAVVFEVREALGRSSIFQRVEGFNYRKPKGESDIVPVVRLILASLPMPDGTAIAQTSVYDAPAMPVGGPVHRDIRAHVRLGQGRRVRAVDSVDLDQEMTNLKKDHEDWWNRLVVR